MLIEVFSIIYGLVILISVASNWKKLPKSALTGFLSGVVLLGYAVYLHMTKQIAGHEIVVFLSVFLIQLASLEVGMKKRKVNLLHHIIKLAIHVIIVIGLLYGFK